MMELAKITSKGQITLPISIRRILNLKDGDKDFYSINIEKPEILTPTEFLDKHS